MKTKSAIGLLMTLLLGTGARLASAATDSDPIRHAMEWLAAVRDKDQRKLTERTHLPFVMEGDMVLGSKKCGRKMKAVHTADFAPIARCLIDDPLLGDSVPPDIEDLAAGWKKMASLDQIPKSTRKYKKAFASLPKDHVLVTGSIVGDGITYELVIAVSADGRIAAVVGDGESVE